MKERIFIERERKVMKEIRRKERNYSWIEGNQNEYPYIKSRMNEERNEMKKKIPEKERQKEWKCTGNERRNKN